MSTSNAHTERQVKAMNNIKTTTRSRLSQCRMNNQFKVAMNSKKGDNFDPQPFVDHYVKLSSEAGEQKIVLQCGQQVPNVFRLRTTYKSNVRRNKSHKNTQSETTIHALPKSLSPVKAEPASDSLVDATHACITPKSTPFKCAPKPLPSSGTKRKSTSAEGTPKSQCRVDNLTERVVLPPMLRAPLNKRMPETVLSELTNLWSKKPPLLHIQSVLFTYAPAS